VQLSSIINKKQKEDQRSANDNTSSRSNSRKSNPFLSRPVIPQKAIEIFLIQARAAARKQATNAGKKFPITKAFVEIEARVGILKSSVGFNDTRVLSSGPKKISHRSGTSVANAFLCSSSGEFPDCMSQQHIPLCFFEGGVTRSHFIKWTGSGLSESGPLSLAFDVKNGDPASIKRDLVEIEHLETVYTGYADNNRLCYKGLCSNNQFKGDPGRMENKTKVNVMDLALPSAPYDLRLTLATETTLDDKVLEPLKGWTSKRLKRRRSYSHRGRKFAWQIDVTEVTTSSNNDSMTNRISSSGASPEISFEIEIELNASTTLKLVNESEEARAQKLCMELSQQLWWMLTQINPLSDILDAEEFLREHIDHHASSLALAQCGSLKSFIDGIKNGSYHENSSSWSSAIVPDESGNSAPPSASLANIKFPGCMPVNFSRHNIEEVQRADGNGYFLSEKTDGVRYLMVFTGKTVVLVDRTMKGKQPIPRNGKNGIDPMSNILNLVNPGTVLDGEVVMHRKLRRPVYIVFDVLSISSTQPTLHLPFEQRLWHLKKATFRAASADSDIFADEAVTNPNIALPLVRKNFVRRTNLDDLLSHVVEEKGLRSYRNGIVHNHLTDGIIFQPNLPYMCGTDVNLLKWKYLDTVTIDVEIITSTQSFHHRNAYNTSFAVLGDEGTRVDMTRHIHLPSSEMRRLEADRVETNAKIAEVGFEPTTGEWYYLTMRPDKVAPNHISTVLGTLLELAESLSTEELRYRMSIPQGGRDTFRKDIKNMQRQLLDHQRKTNKIRCEKERGK